MTALLATVALDVRNTLGEGVLWCSRKNVLYWTDIQRCVLWQYNPADGALCTFPIQERIASFALCEHKDWLLMALSKRIVLFHLPTGKMRMLHDIEPGMETRANDGACDRQGRFVFGTMHEPVKGARRDVGSFYRVNADLSLERLPLRNVAIPNSIAFSPKGDTMYFCDSPARMIMRCAYGENVGFERLFVDLTDLDGVPDGSTVDAEGALWNAQWGMGRVVRYLADGREDRCVRIQASQATRPAFGGQDLRTLYITSAREGLSGDALLSEPHAGALFYRGMDVCGLPEPRFSGLRPMRRRKLSRPDSRLPEGSTF